MRLLVLLVFLLSGCTTYKWHCSQCVYRESYSIYVYNVYYKRLFFEQHSFSNEGTCEYYKDKDNRCR